MNIAVFPGTFDPITIGHINLIQRTKLIFKKVIVAISINENTFFTKEERLEMVKKIFYKYNGIKVMYLKGYLSDFINNVNANTVIRGLRNCSDFDYEFQMAEINKNLNNAFESLFLLADSKYRFLSSTIIRELLKINPKKISKYLDPIVIEIFNKKNWQRRRDSNS